MTFINYLKGYTYILSEPAKKNLRALEKQDAKKIISKLDDLVDGSQNVDVKKMEGYEDSRYRLRVGKFRIFYEIQKHKVIILVVAVTDRKESYTKKSR